MGKLYRYHIEDVLLMVGRYLYTFLESGLELRELRLQLLRRDGLCAGHTPIEG